MGRPQPSFLEDLGPVNESDGAAVDLYHRVVPPVWGCIIPHLIKPVDVFCEGRSRDRNPLNLVDSDGNECAITEFDRAGRNIGSAVTGPRGAGNTGCGSFVVNSCR